MSDKLIPILIGDGGGERALWSMVFIRELVKRLQSPICDLFKHGLVAGVSGGGLNACGLAHPKRFTPDDLIQFFVDNGPKIFHRSWLTNIDSLFDPTFDNNVLAEVLQAHYGETTLHEALCPLFVPCWDLAQEQAVDYTEADYSPMWFACRATAAVPGSFATWGNLVDGGVYGSNPVLWAFANARKRYGMRARFLIISIGTGASTFPVNANSLHGAGALQWALPAIKLLAEANPIVTEAKAPWLFGPDDVYFRWQATLPTTVNSSFADGSKEQSAALIAFAQQVIDSRQAEVAAICTALATTQK